FKQPLTAEAWVTPAENHPQVDSPQHQQIWSRGGCFLGMTKWGWQFYCNKLGTITGAGRAGEPHHLVAQWDGSQCRLFVNGISAVSKPHDDPAAISSDAILPRILGAEGKWEGAPKDGFFHGQMHELRVSKALRYDADFAPPDRDAPFTVDDKTIALYHFDEGQ